VELTDRTKVEGDVAEVAEGLRTGEVVLDMDRLELLSTEDEEAPKVRDRRPADCLLCCLSALLASELAGPDFRDSDRLSGL